MAFTLIFSLLRLSFSVLLLLPRSSSPLSRLPLAFVPGRRIVEKMKMKMFVKTRSKFGRKARSFAFKGQKKMNFKGFGNEPPQEGSGSGKPSGNFNFPLARQSSIYSLTFDEFRNSLGKEIGSMNMDELVKSIWTAEETQNMSSSTAAISSGGGGHIGGEPGWLFAETRITYSTTNTEPENSR